MVFQQVNTTQVLHIDYFQPLKPEKSGYPGNMKILNARSRHKCAIDNGGANTDFPV